MSIGMTQGIIWFIAVVVFLLLEGATYQLVSVYLAIGAVGGLVTYILGFGFAAQMTVFLVLSVLLLCLLRPISLRMMKDKKLKTNAESLIGEKVYITKEVNNIAGSGEGKINGALWTVRSADGNVIPKDTVAVVEKIEGVKLIAKGE